jgi:flagellar hook protein FlgE
MIGSLWNGVSGLNGFDKALSSESNNISNVSTIGYKEDNISFSDMLYQNGHGKGVSVENVSKSISQQGGIKLTNSPYDMSIEGKGFFIIGDSSQNGIPETYYTRAGNFKISDNGILQTQGDMNVLGLSPISTPNVQFDNTYSKTIASQIINDSNALQTINAKSSDYISSASSDSLDTNSGNNYKTKSAKIADIDILIADYKSKLELYSSDSIAPASDSISQISNIDLSTSMNQLVNENDFVKVTINNNEITQQFDTDIATTLKKFSDKISNIQGFSSSVDTNSGILTINSLIPGKEASIKDAQIDGSLLSISNTQDAKLGSGLGLVNSSRDALSIALDRAGAKFLDVTSTISLSNQNNLNLVDKIQVSLEKFNLSNSSEDVEIDNGAIYVKDGENKFLVGKVQTAHFINEQGLSSQGGNLYQITNESGNALNAENMNKVLGNSLEQSKANLSNSLTALLIYQKAFEANSKSITASDEFLKTAIELIK